jgi:hypothetical protein
MAIRVKLESILEGMESQSDESSTFLDRRTGEVVLISDEELRAAEDDDPIEDFPEWEQDLVKIAKEIVAETGDYIPLPSKFDIHEYSIMENFCLSINDAEIRDTLYGLIKGSGAFRRFKDAVYQFGIENEWFNYRNDAFKQIAIDWCNENGIEFEDK